MKKNFPAHFLLSLLIGISLLPFNSFCNRIIPHHALFPTRKTFYSPTIYDVHYYNLILDVDIKNKMIKGNCSMMANSIEAISSINIDLWHNWIIDSVVYNDKKCRIQRDSSYLKVFFNERIKAKNSFTLFVYYHGFPLEAALPPWEDGIVWKKDSLSRPWIGMTCEGRGASLWWPCHDKVTDEADSIKATFILDKGLQCISNGNLQNHTVTSEKEIFTWKTSYPINNYNLTFNIGSYLNFQDSLTLLSGKLLTLDFYALDYHVLMAKQHFQQSKKIILDYSNLFGDYPFIKDNYKLIETSYRGMEHQSAISYGNDFKNDVLDYDFIILHETAHEWWGNSITASDHGELWIHESFATYCEALFIEKNYGKEFSQQYLNLQKSYIKNKTPMLGPLGVYYNKWQDNDIYYKGTWMLHTLRNLIANDSLWFDLLRSINSNFNLSVVSSKDLINYINIKTDTDYSTFFQHYLTQTSAPVLQYYLKRNKEGYLLYYKWSTKTTGYNMPYDIKINNTIKRIYPKNKIQQLLIHITEPSGLTFQEDKMYVTIEKIK